MRIEFLRKIDAELSNQNSEVVSGTVPAMVEAQTQPFNVRTGPRSQKCKENMGQRQ